MLAITKNTLRRCNGDIEFAEKIIETKKNLAKDYKIFRLFNRSLYDLSKMKRAL